jgi:SAM-dependent methyltransferase
MIPVHDEEHNVSLHVNRISSDGKYVDQTDANHFYMYEPDEFEIMVTDIGFKLISKYGGYSGEEFNPGSGKTTVWIFKKPDIKIDSVSLALFKQFEKSKSELRDAILAVWQDAMLEFPYYSVRYYRFIYPRILSHPNYKAMDLKYKRILDIGCGFSTDLHQIFVDSEFTAKLVGIEKSSTFSRMGRQLFGDSAVSLISGDFLDPRKNQRLIDMGPFDQIFTGSLINVLSYEENQSLFNLVTKILVPGGIFYGRFVGRLEDTEPELGYYAYLFSESEFTEKMVSMGFTVEISQMGEDTPKCERSYDDYVVFSFYCVSKGFLSIDEWF